MPAIKINRTQGMLLQECACGVGADRARDKINRTHGVLLQALLLYPV